MYEGFENKETWLVVLHINNNEFMQAYWLRKAGECHANARADETWTRAANAAFALRDMLQDSFDIVRDNTVEDILALHVRAADKGSLIVDFISDSFKEVNWLEVAKNLLD